MNELGPEARAFLEGVRGSHEPDAETKARVRAGLMRRVGVGAAALGTTTATAGAAAGTTGSVAGALFVKATLAALLVGGGGYVATKELRPPPVAVMTASVRVPPRVVTPVVAVPAATVVTVSSVSPPSAPVSLKPVATVVTKPVAAPTLQDELSALRDAHAALRAGDAARALSIVDATKGTALAPERDATRALCLCTLGRAEGRAVAERFLAAHPSSPLAARVRTTCSIP